MSTSYSLGDVVLSLSSVTSGGVLVLTLGLFGYFAGTLVGGDRVVGGERPEVETMYMVVDTVPTPTATVVGGV